MLNDIRKQRSQASPARRFLAAIRRDLESILSSWRGDRTPPTPQREATVPTPQQGKTPADTFCIYPWFHLQMVPTGVARVCCKFGGSIEKDGSPMSISEHSLDAIWNSEQMRGIRRDMVEGRPVAGCQECYNEEVSGGFSMRKRDTERWAHGWLNEEKVSLAKLIADSKQRDHYVSTLPVTYEIDVGNLCNLKCRMCHAESSSRIDADPVHRQWAADPIRLAAADPGIDGPPPPPRLKGSWLTKTPVDKNEILRNAARLKRLYFLGGETLIIKEVDDVLQYLVDMGVAQNIALSFVTNGSTIKSQSLSLARHFKETSIAISIDGFGPYYEYIRYPAKWPTLARNIDAFRKLPNTSVGGAVTLQLYNALNIVELFRYFDSIDMGYYVYPIASPRHLTVGALPPRARAVAAERLRQYATNDCRQNNREMILGLAQQTEATGDHCDMALLRNLMLFTNDLDRSRGQSFAKTHPELFEFIAETGVQWTDETRFLKLHEMTPAGEAAIINSAEYES